MTRSPSQACSCALVLLALAGASVSCGRDERSAAAHTQIKSSKTLGTTRGPNGEQATPTSALVLTPGEVAKVRAGHHTAALAWHENADFVTAVTDGVRDQFDRLWLEGKTAPRVMAISIHPYLTGVPHRIKYLEMLYDYILGHDGVVLWTGAEILDWYRTQPRD